MTDAERIVKILLEDAPEIRGEYWIINGDVAFADGDVGDQNHEGYAIDHARREILNHFNMDSDDEFIDDQTLAERVVEALREYGVKCNTITWYEAAYAYLQRQGADEKLVQTLKCAANRGVDARDIAMKYWGWKWCRRSNIGTWTFTANDRKQIVDGLNEIISQEMHDDEETWDELEITIGVGSTGKRYAMTMAELESGRNVSQDPTWGLRESDADDMMAYMQPEIERITSRRKLKVGEEVSNGTFCMIDLCRRGLAKLEEIDYTGYKRFVEMNKEPIEGLNMILTAHASGRDYGSESEDDTVAAHEALDTLWDVLTGTFNDDYCPFGTHFGSHEGNGSCYGCWPAEDFLRDQVSDYRILSNSGEWPKFPDRMEPDPNGVEHFWLKSHRGNQALYDARTGEKLWEY